MNKTPLKAIKEECNACCNGLCIETHCDRSCPLSSRRGGRKKETATMTVLESIKERCKECNENYKNCEHKDCPLYPFRNGKNPYISNNND